MVSTAGTFRKHKNVYRFTEFETGNKGSVTQVTNDELMNFAIVLFDNGTIANIPLETREYKSRTHGGARKGAGRPSSGKAKKAYTIYLLPDDAATIINNFGSVQNWAAKNVPRYRI
jgi:hypothetical protein